MKKTSNIVWQEGQVTKEDRRRIVGHKNKVIWFTGLSGSGKSTLARAIEKKLSDKGILCYTLDGDNVRHGLCNDLGFSAEDRKENIRRISEVANLFYDAGVFVIVGFISPYAEEREFAKSIIGDDFIEVFVKCPVEECEKRDVKGLYKKARQGIIKNFTGIDDPYEEPENPDIIVETDKKDLNECVNLIFKKLISD